MDIGKLVDKGRKDLEETLKAIKEAPEDDFRTLIKVSKITKKGFSEGTLDSRCFSVEEQNEFITELKKDKEIYKAVGKELENWENLNYESKKKVLNSAYDILMK